MIALEAILSTAERLDQMQQAINRGLPFLAKTSDGFHDGRMSIVGYGPSLRNTWPSISHPMIATSGAYDFLVERGVVPDFYVAIDPRRCTAALLKHPQKQTQYLMASVLHPDFWDILGGFDVKLWHLVSGDDLSTIEWIKTHHPSGMASLIAGGSTVGQRAFNVASMMGYRKFDVFGMDGSFNTDRHAGNHTAEAQPVIMAHSGSRSFRTTPQLLQSVNEIKQFLLTNDVEAEFYGDGLIQAAVSAAKRR